MKALLIGGTGTLSSAVSRQILAAGHELFLYNRGNRNQTLPEGFREIAGDINDEKDAASKLKSLNFDVVADFTAMKSGDLERDWRLFQDKTRQFIFISSASAYQKPSERYPINESSPLSNPYWPYAQDKIAGEEFLMRKYRDEGFPITIIRPSHTYDERKVPVGAHGKRGTWQVVKRILEGKPVIIHGDGTSLWTITHNSDFARGFMGMLGNIHALGQRVQICSHEIVTWNQVYRVIADALGKPLKSAHISSFFLASAGRAQGYDFLGSLLGDKANSMIFDNTKLKEMVPGFVPQVRIDQGIPRTLDYILSHKELQEEDQEFDLWCDRVIAARDRALKEFTLDR